MKIEILQDGVFGAEGARYDKGHTPDVPDDVAEALIEKGLAKFADDNDRQPTDNPPTIHRQFVDNPSSKDASAPPAPKRLRAAVTKGGPDGTPQ